MTVRGRRIGIVGHTGRVAVRRVALGLARRLARRGCAVRVEQVLAGQIGVEGHSLAKLSSWCQILVSLGGDGTTLAGARALAGKRGVLLPVNLGGLGFLTVAEVPELDLAIEAALGNRWPIVERRTVAASVRRRGRVVLRGLALNDVVVKSAGGYAAIHLRLEVLGSDLGHLVADGLIAATAAGSTAYSLSAGGPLLAPDVEALVVTPACAHSLGSRSLVLGPSAELRVRVLGSPDRPIVLYDGQEPIPLEPRDEVLVRLGRHGVRVFQNPDRPFTYTLRAKLGWQGSAKRSM